MAQIMAVTGHKSALSVAEYQRVSSKEKQVMGDIITSSVRGEQPSQLSSIMQTWCGPVTSKVLKAETLTHFNLLIVMFKFVMVQPWNMGVC
jgi:hypothetical protein